MIYETDIIYLLLPQDAYYAERVIPLREKKAPAYSFGSRTRYHQKDSNPAPNQYSLPNLTSSRVPHKTTMPSYSMTGRSRIGGFHEDLQKVIFYFQQVCH